MIFLNIQRKFGISIGNFRCDDLINRFSLETPLRKFYEMVWKWPEFSTKISKKNVYFISKINLTDNSFVGAWLIFLVWVLKFSKFFDQKNDHWRHVAYLDIKSGALINFFTVLEVNRAVLNSQKFLFSIISSTTSKFKSGGNQNGKWTNQRRLLKSENTPHDFGGLIGYFWRMDPKIPRIQNTLVKL